MPIISQKHSADVAACQTKSEIEEKNGFIIKEGLLQKNHRKPANHKARRLAYQKDR